MQKDQFTKLMSYTSSTVGNVNIRFLMTWNSIDG